MQGRVGQGTFFDNLLSQLIGIDIPLAPPVSILPPTVMPPLRIQPRALRSTGSLLRAGFATQKSRSRPSRKPVTRSSLSRPSPRTPPLFRRVNSLNNPQQPPQNASEEKKSSVDSISSALHHADPSSNDLLSPVHIPEDPNGVLTENHPATNILRNSAIVITRQLELMNVMMGFEQANKYVIMDPHGQHLGFMAEKDLGMGSMFKRQMFSTHRSFTTHIFDKFGKEVLRVSFGYFVVKRWLMQDLVSPSIFLDFESHWYL